MIDHPAAPGPQASPSDPLPAAALVQVVFKGHRVEVFSNPEQIPLCRWQAVIVEVERGTDLGHVFLSCGGEMRRKRDQEVHRILRPAAPEEIQRLEEVRATDASALALVKERVARFGLAMHLVDAEHQFDGHRVTFFFTADHRVDFRDLVRDLAAIFRTRIELRQISTREAARRLGGIGTCGRALCCACVLCGFERVSLQSARDQKLAMSPTRLSGVCGRLLCCLNFEMEDESEPPPETCDWRGDEPGEAREEQIESADGA